MTMISRLSGWFVHIEPRTFTGEDERGEEIEIEGHALVFTETEPSTGDAIIFEFDDAVREYLHQETRPK